MTKWAGCVLAAALASGAGFAAEPGDLAAKFGVRESVENISLSPDGMHLAYLAPAGGQGSALYTVALPGGEPKRATAVDGKNERLAGCGWVSNARLVCQLFATAKADTRVVTITRLVAINADGSGMKIVSAADSLYQRRWSLYGGAVLDWLPGETDSILVQRDYVPEDKINTRLSQGRDGLGVERVNTATMARVPAQDAVRNAAEFITDGRGQIRIMGIQPPTNSSQMAGAKISYSYRKAAGGGWLPFASLDVNTDEGLNPYAIDPDLNVAYAMKKMDGRLALVRVDLAGSLAETVAYANPRYDVAGLVLLGRKQRVIGASFISDKREIVYFDAAMKALAASLSKALPGLPLIRFAGASDDEQKLLIWAGSDTDPGRYYWFDRETKRLDEIMLARPQLEGVALAPVKAVSYRAADGTEIPAYLTVPAGSTGKKLPALVLPHGGPSARDEWGFDWLSQYFAARGYVVLQPQFRGSSGYGDAWFKNQGFKQWKVAIGDVDEAGRWLVAQGIADPAKLAVFGWSYGGYAALQSQVMDPDLFKAVVAVAPVTDLTLLSEQYRGYTDYNLAKDFIGTGPHVNEGSPARNAGRFKAPVLIFQGEVDANVAPVEARFMDDALAKAGKAHQLVLYPGLDHQLDDSAARADMLAKSDAFLRTALGL